MFYVRPVEPDDLPAVLGLSERTGHGLTTLPANRERLASRIDRSVASFAGTASRADACYVFVLVDAATARVVGIAAIEAAVGLKEPWYNYHVGTLVHASQRARGLHRRTHAVPVERPYGTHGALLAVPRSGATGGAATVRCSPRVASSSSPNSPSASRPR